MTCVKEHHIAKRVFSLMFFWIYTNSISTISYTFDKDR